jgi:lipid-A-disaccharide synthase
MSAPRIFVLATEPSGDLLGAALIRALGPAFGEAPEIAGVGGPRMAAEGVASLFPLSDIAIMGGFELIPHARRLLRRLRETVEAIRAFRPDVLVTIDGYGFNARIARRLADRSFPIVHFVAPKVWAWRPKRARVLAGLVDHLMVQFPFETPWFEREGLPTTFVGHPIIDAGADRGDARRFRAQFGIAEDERILTVLPGSRRGEVRRLLPIFGGVVERLAAARPDLRIVVPLADAVAPVVRPVVERWAGRPIALTGDGPKYDAFAASAAALAASGTVALELGIAQVPSVIAYRINPATHFIFRGLLKTPWVNLVNIMLQREAVPEHIQGPCTVEALVPAIGRLLDDPAAAEAQRAAGREVAAMLRLEGATPAARAAAMVVEVARKGRARA